MTESFLAPANGKMVLHLPDGRVLRRNYSLGQKKNAEHQSFDIILCCFYPATYGVEINGEIADYPNHLLKWRTAKNWRKIDCYHFFLCPAGTHSKYGII